MITLKEGNNELNVELVPVYVPPPVGVLYGIVKDANTGSPLSGVKVTINNRTVNTDSSGFYTIGDILPGDYSVKFEKSGYVTLTL